MMKIDLDYTPTHKRVLRDGQTPRGPARWFRAADNAMRKPTSKGGKLFWHRAALANAIMEEYGAGGPAQFFEYERDRSEVEVGGVWRYKPTEKRKYVTCNNFCTSMQVLLDFDNEYIGFDPVARKSIHRRAFTARTLETFLEQDPRVDMLWPGQLNRAVRCEFCGSKVSP